MFLYQVYNVFRDGYPNSVTTACTEPNRSNSFSARSFSSLVYIYFYSLRSPRICPHPQTLSNLKRLRHIRTQLAHEVGTMDAEMCDRRDIDWLKAFRQSILDTSDPVAVLTRKSAAQRPSRRTAPAYRQPYSGYVRQTPYSDFENKPRRSVFSTRFWIFIIIMIAIFIAVIVINHTHIFI